MNNQQIKALGMIAQALIRAMGYQATNQQRLANGLSIAYGDDAFFGEANDIQQAVDKLAEPTLPENPPHA